MSLGMASRYVRKIDGAVIVNYHGIEPPENIVDPSIQSVHRDPDSLKRQLEFIAQHFDVLGGIDDLRSRNVKRDRPAALITFDDGYQNFLTHALPILEEVGVPSTVFLTANCVENDARHPSYLCRATIGNFEPGTYHLDSISRTIEVTPENRFRNGRDISELMKGLPWEKAQLLFAELESHFSAAELREIHDRYPSDKAMTWDEVREAKSRGVTIGSHTLDHVVLGRRQSEELIRTQVVESRRLITERIGECKTFAYPNGLAIDVSPAAVRAVEEAGYDWGFCTMPGVTNIGRLDSIRFVLPRLSVGNNWSGFRKYVSAAWRHNARHAAFVRQMHETKV